MSEPHQFVLNSSQGLDLKFSDKYAALQNSYIYYTLKNMRKQYKNNKRKMIWKDEFELSYGSYFVSDI